MLYQWKIAMVISISIWILFHYFIVNIAVFYSVGRGDSSHLVTRGDSSHSPLWGENTWKSKNKN